MKIRGVAFDIDGTLYPNLHMYLFSLLPGLRHPRLSMAFGRVRKAIREIRPVENFRHLQARMIAEHIGSTPEHAYALAEKYLYDRWSVSFKGLKAYPDVRKVLEEFKSRGLKLAAMSDFPIQKKFEYLGLTGLWDAAFTAEDTNYLKPHPEPFQRIIDELGLPAEEILYVGNSYAYDIRGAGGMGMHTAHLSRHPHKDSLADFTFFRYIELRDFVFDHCGV